MQRTCKRVLVLVLVLVMALKATESLANIDGAGADSRIRTFVYGSDDIFRVTSNFGYQTVIELDENEKIVTISLGNSNIFKIIPSNNRLFIKAMQNGFTTNMTIITDVRTYQFELTSLVNNSEDIMYVVRFIYPESIITKTASDITASSEVTSGPMQLYSPILLPGNRMQAPVINRVPNSPMGFNNTGGFVPSVSGAMNFSQQATDGYTPLSLQYRNSKQYGGRF